MKFSTAGVINLFFLCDGSLQQPGENCRPSREKSIEVRKIEEVKSVEVAGHFSGLETLNSFVALYHLLN